MASVMAPTQPIFGKRRSRDDIEPDHKRVRIDRLLSKLSLDEPSPIEQDLKINPLLEFSDEESRPKSSIDKYISEKLIASMQAKAQEGLAVGRWYIPAAIVSLHFQRWVRRLFNRFIRRYNASHPERTSVKTFRSYFNIVKFVCSEVNFSLDDLRQAVMEENVREQREIVQRRHAREDKRHFEEITEEESLAAESLYTYWDRFAEASGDMDMEMETEMETGSGLDLDMMDI